MVATKRDEDLLRDSDSDDEHFDDLPFYEKSLEDSSRSYKFNHGYVSELMDKEEQLKKAQL